MLGVHDQTQKTHSNEVTTSCAFQLHNCLRKVDKGRGARLRFASEKNAGVACWCDPQGEGCHWQQQKPEASALIPFHVLLYLVGRLCFLPLAEDLLHLEDAKQNDVDGVP